MSSNSTVEVVRVGPVRPHPNADRLGLITVHDLYTVVVGLDSWREGDIGAYVAPDSIVPISGPFGFLSDPNHPELTSYRVRGKKLRGIISEGLLVPAPTGAVVGDDVAAQLGVTRYEPAPAGFSDQTQYGEPPVEPPPGDSPVYDLEPLQRYASTLEEGEEVYITEKLHGANSRFTYRNGRIYCGSRRTWKDPNGDSTWASVIRQNPGIIELCRSYPGATLYGEVYGWVQDLRYGHKPGEVSFAAFDLLTTSGWKQPGALCAELLYAYGLRPPPLVYCGPLPDRDALMAMASGPSLVPGANHIREGIVVRPIKERWDPRCGRVHLKLVSPEYLLRQE